MDAGAHCRGGVCLKEKKIRGAAIHVIYEDRVGSMLRATTHASQITDPPEGQFAYQGRQQLIVCNGHFFYEVLISPAGN